MTNEELMIAMMQAWNSSDMGAFSTLCKEAAERNLAEWSEE